MSDWRKSSRSSNNGQCVELRSQGEAMQVRDSKLGEASPIFDLKTEDLVALLNAAQRGPQ